MAGPYKHLWDLELSKHWQSTLRERSHTYNTTPPYILSWGAHSCEQMKAKISSILNILNLQEEKNAEKKIEGTET